MPSKSLTLKFGADTSKLDRALGRLRKGMATSLRSAGRRGIGIGGAAVGGALGGFAGGAFAGGAVGMARGLFGELMDASPAFAQTMLGLAESIRTTLQPQMERLASSLIAATPQITKFAGEMIDASSRVLRILTGQQMVTDPGYFSTAGAAAGARAVADLAQGDVTGLGQGSSIEESRAFVGSLLTQAADAAGYALFGTSGERAPLEGTPISAPPGGNILDVYKYEGIAPGTI